jgi:hypothetical protein
VWCSAINLNDFHAFSPNAALLVVTMALLCLLLLAPCLGKKLIGTLFKSLIGWSLSIPVPVQR